MIVELCENNTDNILEILGFIISVKMDCKKVSVNFVND